MLTKGIILSRVSNSNKYFVRIPYLETAGIKSDSLEAIASIVPGITETLLPDDVVIIGFEDHQPSKPIILGKLFINEEKARGMAEFEGLNVTDNANLPKNTSIAGLNIYKELIGIINKINSVTDDIPEEQPTPPTPSGGTTLKSHSVVFTYDDGDYDSIQVSFVSGRQEAYTLLTIENAFNYEALRYDFILFIRGYNTYYGTVLGLDCSSGTKLVIMKPDSTIMRIDTSVFAAADSIQDVVDDYCVDNS